jgi:UrcA family protein
MNTKTQITKAVGAFVIGVAILGAAHAAQPIVVDDVLTTKVQFGDLNVDSTAGAKILYGRLRTAAGIVCSPFQSEDLGMRAQWQRCYDGALASAVGKINNAALTQIHDKSTNPSQSVVTRQALAKN